MIWCVEDDPSIRELETYVLNSTGLEVCGFLRAVSQYAFPEET